jgi:hypothetical protein
MQSYKTKLLNGEVDRLKRLVAELMLDKQMLQDIAKNYGGKLGWMSLPP